MSDISVVIPCIPKHLKHLNSSGTIVCWSQLSNPKWTSGEGILRNAEEIIGRMYRIYLQEGVTSVDIRLVNVDAKGQITIDRNAITISKMCWSFRENWYG